MQRCMVYDVCQIRHGYKCIFLRAVVVSIATDKENQQLTNGLVNPFSETLQQIMK